tara:strand:- start:6244 stop:7038 length:795 start_codon:yes stop_codon:yes gene_type:complete
VCVDANAGARATAQQRAREKDANFQAEGLKFFNKEIQLERAQESNVIGYSRDNSDAYVRALKTIGKGRAQVEDATRAYFASQKVNEGGRSSKFGAKNYQVLLSKRKEVDSIIDNVLGTNQAYANTLSQRKFQTANAKAREALGIPPAYGAPVMMPPTNRLGGALQIAQTGLSIASSMYGLGAFGASGGGPLSFISDIRLKENIKQVGTSPQGYNIYEFNYKGGEARFRGAMAQDVLQKNPMAVGIDQNHLTVDYSKIDVIMEVA